MTTMLRRWKRVERIEQVSAMARPSYDDYRIQSAILGYVVGEGHHEKTVSSLLRWYSQAHGGEADAIKRAFLDLLGRGMLGIEGGKVVPFRMEHVAQWVVLMHVVYGGHHGKTIPELSQVLSPESLDSSVERAVREFVGAGLLSIEGGKVVPGHFGLAGQGAA